MSAWSCLSVWWEWRSVLKICWKWTMNIDSVYFFRSFRWFMVKKCLKRPYSFWHWLLMRIHRFLWVRLLFWWDTEKCRWKCWRLCMNWGACSIWNAQKPAQKSVWPMRHSDSICGKTMRMWCRHNCRTGFKWYLYRAARNWIMVLQQIYIRMKGPFTCMAILWSMWKNGLQKHKKRLYIRMLLPVPFISLKEK